MSDGKCMRIDKLLSELGIMNRSEAKKAAKAGRISIDGVTCTSAEQKVNPNVQKVELDGSEIGYADYEYFMLNKPAGVVSATEDARDETVVGLIKTAKRNDLFPVGRLDKDTEGLLLITNDGVLAHKLLSPKKHVPKKYFAHVEGKVTDKEIEIFKKGMDLGDFFTKPAELEIVSEGDNSTVYVTITEGKFHQVKRMFEAVGMKVKYLKRLSMGSLVLDTNLAPGEYRELTESELKKLKDWEGIEK